MLVESVLPKSRFQRGVDVSRKLSPYEAFVDNIEDAESLLSYAHAFQNRRARSMRSELRSRIGEALKVAATRQNELDCLESDDLFVVFKPGGNLGRDGFTDLRPLLRQALIAASAALETYIADKAMEFVGSALKANEMPRNLRDISLTVGLWAEIEQNYERRKWGIRAIVEDYIRKTSSTAPNKIGTVLSTIGLEKWAGKVDGVRKVTGGTTVRDLDAITKRRNLIAHTADRKGRGRASVEHNDVQRQIEVIKDVVAALEKILNEHRL